MPNTCSICADQRIREIDEDLLSGASVRDVEGRYGISKSAVDRHRRKCLGPKALRALARHEEQTEERIAATANGILDRLAFQAIRAQQAAIAARGDDDAGTERLWMADERAALRDLTKALETQARIVGVLGERPQVTIDARKQIAVLAAMSEEELRALASGAGELLSPAGELVQVVDAA